MKILLTGATGFIGQHLAQALVLRGDEVAALVREGSRTESLPEEVVKITVPGTQAELEELFKQEQLDGVIHLASLYLMSHTSGDVETLIDSNVKFGTKVLDAAAKVNVRFFINTGSFAQHFEGHPYSPTNLYAATKQAFQDIATYYAETTNTVILTLELFNTYGPGDTRNKIFNLWHKAMKNGQAIDMSPGEQIIDISYIDDIVEAFLLAVNLANSEKVVSGQSFAIPSPERMSLKDLSRIFREALQADLKVNFGALPYRERETMVPMDKAEVLPGWRPKIGLKEGIRRTFMS